MPPQVQAFNAYDLFQLIHPEYGTIRCVGTAVTYHRRCRNQIHVRNRATAESILRDLPSSVYDPEVLDGLLHRLAGLLCCKGSHQKQIKEVATRWKRIILAETRRTQQPETRPRSSRSRCTPEREDEDSKDDEIRRLRRQVEELRRQRDTASQGQRDRTSRTDEGAQETGQSRPAQSQSAGRGTPPRSEQRSSEEEVRHEEEARREEARREEEAQRAEERRQEARRQAQRERAEQEADARRRAERERSRQRREEARQQQEQEKRDREEQERRSWEDGWTRHQRDWSNMARIDTSSLDEQVRESIPWPVREGRWQDVNDANVAEFLRHAPEQSHEARPDDFVRFLRDQARRWHPDAMGRAFPGLIGNTEVMILVTLVMQVINREIATARRRKNGSG